MSMHYIERNGLDTGIIDGKCGGCGSWFNRNDCIAQEYKSWWFDPISSREELKEFSACEEANAWMHMDEAIREGNWDSTKDPGCLVPTYCPCCGESKCSFRSIFRFAVGHACNNCGKGFAHVTLVSSN